ncbi:uncharacterized protein LOC141632455 isoform X2 [Silene latifolia]|uniref:uncharacterized protein LOC141632455 isoform X2 n=1 Tax=Silene latifolia TaxID=37657 RepID=UPI003D778808
MQAAVANLKENVQRLTEALEKTEKLLLQRIQNRDTKIDEQEEMAQLILNEGIKRNMADAVDSVTENLQSSNEALDQELSISDDINRFLSAREKEAKDLLQRVNKTKDEHRELLERIKEKVRYAREEFGNDNDKLDYLTETVDKMAWFESVEKLYPQRARDRKEIKMDEVEKEKMDRMAWFESVEKLYRQRAEDRMGIEMDGVEKKQECIVARKSHGDTFADQ